MDTRAIDPQSIERMREERALLSRLVRRRSEALQFLQLMTKSFTSLLLKDKSEIGDTLSSLVLTFFEARFGAVVLRSASGDLTVSGCQGASPAALTGAAAVSALQALMDDKTAQLVDAERAERLWPDRPAPMRGGFACCTIESNDTAVGLILVSDKSSGESVADEELEFLAAAAGLGGMALSNADLLVAQTALTGDVQRQVEQAKRESAEKQRALDELDRKLEVIEQQKAAIRELSTPILQVGDDVLALPLIGNVDVDRSEDVMEKLLTEVTARRASFVIIDVTGVLMVDTSTASYLQRMVRATELLGASCLLTGIRPAVAQALVSVGAEMSELTTLRTLREGLAECSRRQQRRR